MYKGTGTINNEAEGEYSEYKFILSAIDGHLKNGDGIDLFRIRIWEEDLMGNEYAIYDNHIGAEDEYEDPLQPIDGGSIVIHKRKT